MQTRVNAHQDTIKFTPIDIVEAAGAGSNAAVEQQFHSDVAALVVQYPNTEGLVYEHLDALIQTAHRQNVSDEITMSST